MWCDTPIVSWTNAAPLCGIGSCHWWNESKAISVLLPQQRGAAPVTTPQPARQSKTQHDGNYTLNTQWLKPRTISKTIEDLDRWVGVVPGTTHTLSSLLLYLSLYKIRRAS